MRLLKNQQFYFPIQNCLLSNSLNFLMFHKNVHQKILFEYEYVSVAAVVPEIQPKTVQPPENPKMLSCESYNFLMSYRNISRKSFSNFEYKYVAVPALIPEIFFCYIAGTTCQIFVNCFLTTRSFSARPNRMSSKSVKSTNIFTFILQFCLI